MKKRDIISSIFIILILVFAGIYIKLNNDVKNKYYIQYNSCLNFVNENKSITNDNIDSFNNNPNSYFSDFIINNVNQKQIPDLIETVNLCVNNGGCFNFHSSFCSPNQPWLKISEYFRSYGICPDYGYDCFYPQEHFK